MRTHLCRDVLNSSPQAHQEFAAWELLEAVGELFPKRFAELEALGKSYLEVAEMGALGSYPDDEGDPFLVYGQPFGDVHEGLLAFVHEWTLNNGISSSAVDDVATKIAGGQAGPEPGWTEIDSGNPDEPTAIRAWPFDETLAGRGETPSRPASHREDRPQRH